MIHKVKNVIQHRKEGAGQYSMKRQESSTAQKGSVCSKNNYGRMFGITGREMCSESGRRDEQHNGVSIVQ
jgi:hypothetical protein